MDKVTQKGMTKPEYTAIRQLWALQNLFTESVKPSLEHRAGSLIPGGSSELEEADKALRTITKHMVSTIPLNRKQQMLLELQHTYMDVVTRYGGCPVPENYAIIKEQTLIKLMIAAQEHECDMCAKCGREVDRCPLRSLFNECMMHQHPKNDDGTCPFSEYKIK